MLIERLKQVWDKLWIVLRALGPKFQVFCEHYYKNSSNSLTNDGYRYILENE